MSTGIRVLGGAAAFGLSMRAAADLAAHPHSGWLLWVVNWAALWLIVPFAAGRLSHSAASAGMYGSFAAAAEVAVYYGPENVAAFKVVWLVTGAAAGAAFGALGRRTKGRRSALLVIPIVLVLEPLLLTAVFVLLGRPLGPHWFISASGELVVGLLVAVGSRLGPSSSLQC